MTTHPDDRKLLRIEARNSQTPIERKPEWIKTRANMGPEYTRLLSLVKTEGLHTVCQEAACPNIFECWEDKEATFLIGGDRCTRRCDCQPRLYAVLCPEGDALHRPKMDKDIRLLPSARLGVQGNLVGEA